MHMGELGRGSRSYAHEILCRSAGIHVHICRHGKCTLFGNGTSDIWTCRLQNHVASNHTYMHRCTNTQYLLLWPPIHSHSSLSSVEFISKMNLSVTGRLQLQEKHTFQHLGSGRESREEKSGSCWDSRRRTGSKGGAVVQDSEKLV